MAEFTVTVEQRLLSAALDDDDEALCRAVAELLPGEIQLLRRALTRVERALDEAEERREARHG